MNTGLQAIGLFAVTNIDDVILMALFFAAGTNAKRIVIGQYLGFAAILALVVLATLGTTLLPEGAVRYLGLVPIALGIRAWLQRDDEERAIPTSVVGVATVTFANGGDNIGVYVPVFAQGGTVIYCAVFLVLVAPLCRLGWFAATRPPIARTLERVGHIVFPVVLVAIGLAILILPSH